MEEGGGGFWELSGSLPEQCPPPGLGFLFFGWVGGLDERNEIPAWPGIMSNGAVPSALSV